MAGREELYLKHIDENTGRIAKALEKIAVCAEANMMNETGAEQIYLKGVKDAGEYIAKFVKSPISDVTYMPTTQKELVEPVKKQDEYDEVAEFENAYNIVIDTLIKNGMMSCDVDEIDMMMDQYWPKGGTK